MFIDAEKVAATLGFRGLPGNPQQEALRKALQLSGAKTDLNRIGELLEIAGRVFREPTPQPGTTLARRLALGGIYGGLLGGIAYGSPQIGVPASVGFVMASRGIGNFLLDPGKLRLLTEGLKPNAGEVVTRRLLGLLAEGFVKGGAAGGLRLLNEGPEEPPPVFEPGQHPRGPAGRFAPSKP